MLNFKSKIKRPELLLILFSALFYQSSIAGNGYSIPKHTISNGGGESTGGSYKVNGSIAQILTADSQGGAFSVNSGFWQSSINTDIIFKNSFEQ